MINRKKRYIQPCEIGGSIYGRNGIYGLREKKDKTSDVRGASGTVSSYRDFYRKQADTLEKIFRRGR